jgi:hypothetical protein
VGCHDGKSLTYMVSEGSVLKYFEDDAFSSWGSCESEILVRSKCCSPKLLFVLDSGVNRLFSEQKMFFKVNSEPSFYLNRKFKN